jgi:hypothetical protein
MDRLTELRQLVKAVLHEQTIIPFSYGKIDIETMFDETTDRYAVFMVGWKDTISRTYGSLAHIDIIDGKLWIQRDGTAEGLPNLLMEKGVAKDEIVIAYRTPAEQKFMGFALV